MTDQDQLAEFSFRTEIDLYYDLFVPESAQRPAPLLIAVHGYGAHKRHMMREAKLVAPPDFVIASIQGIHQHFRKTDDGYRTGFGWLTDYKPEESINLHQRFIHNIVDRYTNDGTVDRSRIFLYGFSQACALNFRFAFTYPELVRGIIGVCGGIPGDLETNALYKPFSAETFYLYGDDDEFYTNEKFIEFDRKLNEKLLNYRSKQYAAKHEITEEMRGDIRGFIANTEI